MMEARRVYLIVRGFDDEPSSVLAKLPILGSRVWAKDQLLTPGRPMRYVDNGWELQSDLPQDREISEHVQHLIHLIKPYHAALGTLTGQPGQLSFRLLCVIQGDTTNPSFFLYNDLLKEIVMLGFSLDVDIYVTE